MTKSLVYYNGIEVGLTPTLHYLLFLEGELEEEIGGRLYFYITNGYVTNDISHFVLANI
jgi:hypothetical protein